MRRPTPDAPHPAAGALLRQWRGRVGIVELDGHLVGEGMDFVAVGPEAAQDVVERAGDEEVLLLEAQVAPLLNVVVGIQHLGNVFGEGFGL